MEKYNNSNEMLDMLINTGRIFSYGKSFTQIFSELMSQVCNATGADGGSLYIYDHASETLKIVVMRSTPLGIDKVVESFDALRIKGFLEVPTRVNGELNLRTVSVCSFLENRIVLIPSLEGNEEFDFTNTRNFDKQNDYKTRNLAVLPLTGHSGDVVGVLQLVNCNDSAFAPETLNFIEAIAGQVGIMLSNALLVNEAQELMDAIVQMIGTAIDEKSPHTAGHCHRVVALTMMIAETMEKDTDSIYKNFTMTSDQRRELQIAALLHDVGKIITPTHILEKPTKLHTLDDKISLLNERMRSWELMQELSHIKRQLKEKGMDGQVEKYTPTDKEYLEDYEFLDQVNKGNLFVDDDVRARLDDLSHRMIERANEYRSPQLINNEELDNLKIIRGTLNPEERKIMESHVNISIRLLSSIPWPSNLQKVVEYAGAHHENMDGSGYPNNLTGQDMELPARILGIADRFEGLSAPDRPYRNVKMTLSRVMFIMEDMAAKDQIDKEMFEFFKRKNLHLKYAKKYLPEELIDIPVPEKLTD